MNPGAYEFTVIPAGPNSKAAESVTNDTTEQTSVPVTWVRPRTANFEAA
jgi:hypothetical protein